MKHLQGLPVLVLGLGDSGLAMARWCARWGAAVRVWDSREAPPQRAALGDAGAFFGGTLTAESLGDARLVLKSPGLAPHDPRIAPVLDAAARAGIAVQGELDLYVRALADLAAERGYAPALLAVTGTNGKTTTTAMTALLVEGAGRRVAMAGNIGPSMLTTLGEALDSSELPEVWVLELSSFQLDGVRGFEPSAATVLNLTEDHLDWHGSMAAYAEAKGRVFGRDAVMVVNRDDARVMALAEALLAPPAGKPPKKKPVPRRVVRFGLDAPSRPGDFGLLTDHGIAWLVRAHDDEVPRRRRGDAAESEPDELHLQRLMPADALRLRGRHNAANALAALALASAIGCPLAPMLHGLREYAGEPHRVEHVAGVDGVDFFDDSKGTNVGATVAAIAGLGADRAPGRLVVLLGGDGKGQDFAPLADPVARFARGAVLIGRDGPLIRAVLDDTGVTLVDAASMEEAVRAATQRAHAGDAVLMSPACASFDMFRDYKHRGDAFAAAVRRLG